MPPAGKTAALTAEAAAVSDPELASTTEAAEADDFVDDIGEAVAAALNDEGDEPDDEEAEDDVADEGDGEEDVAAGDEEAEDDTTEDDATEEVATDAASAQLEASPDAGTAAVPGWEPLAVRADKEIVPIAEARVAKVGEHVFLAVPEKDFAQFQQRLGMGIVGQRMWRQLDAGIKELEARKNAPAAKSDAEIEAEITLDALKPFLPELLDAKDVELLTARVKLAQREAKDAFATAETERVSKATEPSWEMQQANGLATTVVSLAKQFPDLKGLTDQDIEDVFNREFVPVKNALFWRDGNDTFANTQYIYDRLKARAEQKQAAPAATALAPSSAPGHKPATPSTTAAPTGKTPAAQADRFNRGVDSAARTTSVKANRTARPAATTTRRADRQARRPSTREAQAVAEDRYRKNERAYLNSPGLDFEEVDDGDE